MVLLKRNQAGRVIGKNATTINLIKAKSGAALAVEHNPESSSHSGGQAPTIGGQEVCKINVTGAAQCVTLAAQMVQEVTGDHRRRG